MTRSASSKVPARLRVIVGPMFRPSLVPVAIEGNTSRASIRSRAGQNSTLSTDRLTDYRSAGTHRVPDARGPPVTRAYCLGSGRLRAIAMIGAHGGLKHRGRAATLTKYSNLPK